MPQMTRLRKNRRIRGRLEEKDEGRQEEDKKENKIKENKTKDKDKDKI